MTDRITAIAADQSLLGTYLKDRRARLNPAALGLAPARRRTAGLRREEVAQRAHISTTWYTWLEQGRGGAPSASVLDRIARALMLTEAEREHVFLLGLGRLPDVRYRTPEGVTPRLQRVLDSMVASPAFIRTVAWDVVAWNRAAAVVLTDYGALAPAERNILRLLFCDPRAREEQPNWESVARFVVAVFRAETTRAGATAEVASLVEDLSRLSADFVAMWRNHDVQSHGEGIKQIEHRTLGPLTLEYSAFAVDGRPDLSMVIFNPVSDTDAARLETLARSG